MNEMKEVRTMAARKKPAADPVRRIAYTVDEAAVAAGTSHVTVREWMHRDDGLPYIKVGAKAIIRVDSLEKWLVRLEQEENQ